MADRFQLILCIAGFLGLVTLLALQTEPGKGLMKLTERLCLGAAMCWLLGIILAPLGIQIAQSPLAALSAGFLGFPGAALASFLACWP